MCKTMWLTCTLLIMAVGEPYVRAATSEKEDAIRLTKLTVTPATEPIPALRYRLLPGIRDQRRENAALFYHMATAAYPAPEDAGPYGEDPLKEKLVQWLELPNSQLPRSEIGKALSAFSETFHQIEFGARCDRCDWGLPMEEGFELRMLPLSTYRNIARAMAVQVRLQVTEGDFDGAAATLQNAMAMARHLAAGPTLVQNLVGMSISGLMFRSVESWVQQPDAPNLYWALMGLPDPPIDTRRSLDFEQDLIFLEYPQLRDLDQTVMTPDQAKNLVKTLLERIGEFGEDSAYGALHALLPMAWVMIHYADAKAYLAERGWSQATIEAMPAAQLVLCYQTQDYLVLRDNAYKWMSVPYAQAQPYLQQAEKALSQVYSRGVKTNLLVHYMPALYRVGFLQYRLSRDMAMLRVVEALRLYAAGHAGHLPETLSQIEALPIPTDPITGQAFGYRRIDDRQARLEAPVSAEEIGPRPVYQLNVRP